MSEMEDERTVTEKVLEELSIERNWCKGHFENEDYSKRDEHGNTMYDEDDYPMSYMTPNISHCLIGSYCLALFGEVFNYQPRGETGLILERHLQPLINVIMEQYPEMYEYNQDMDMIINFNDNVETRHSDIVRVLEKAVVKEQEKI
jgi:hypothetical protein